MVDVTIDGDADRPVRPAAITVHQGEVLNVTFNAPDSFNTAYLIVSTTPGSAALIERSSAAGTFALGRSELEAALIEGAAPYHLAIWTVSGSLDPRRRAVTTLTFARTIAPSGAGAAATETLQSPATIIADNLNGPSVTFASGERLDLQTGQGGVGDEVILTIASGPSDMPEAEYISASGNFALTASEINALIDEGVTKHLNVWTRHGTEYRIRAARRIIREVATEPNLLASGADFSAADFSAIDFNVAA